MSKTDEYFNSLAVRLKHDPAGLLALSQIMESHMRYSIDPRLSSDPLTALAAFMREHNISIELDHDSEMSSVTINTGSQELYYIERDDSVGFITSNDIKPEPSND